MKTILIADDEKRIRDIYRQVLSREGFCVLESDNAEAAYETLLKTPVDIILLDIKMPQVDGGILFKIIDTFIHRTKVIVASVYSIESQKTVVKGAADYYDKSDGINVLVEKIRACVTQ
ncbi:MAG: response regulator [Desulfobacteraceae bacterium]|jgi:two-component system response regulator ResD|nr:MAG: response regulator [Desulfobacteraceae bacterium]